MTFPPIRGNPMLRNARRALLGALLGWAPLAAAQQPVVSVIIDDLGDRWSTGEQAVSLPGPIGCAFLPESAFTRRLADLAHGHGKEVLLHLPLEPLIGKAHPLALSRVISLDQREALLGRALGAVPHAIGVNNHQGSLMTERRADMDWLMSRILRRGGLFFIDSYTTPLSVAYDAARAQGLATTRRQVFLDATRNPEAIRGALARLVKLARANGSALAIGHPFEATLAVLKRELPRLEAQGVRLVAPSELIRLQESRSPIRSRVLRLRLSQRLTMGKRAPALPPVSRVSG